MLSFGSQNHPIRPYKLNTDNGTVFIRELHKGDFTSKGKGKHKQEAFSKLLVDNFADGSTDPGWVELRDKTSKKYTKAVEGENNYIQELFSRIDPNQTILVAENKKGKPVAAMIMNSYAEIEGIEDAKTGHVDTCVVSKEYRGQHLARKMLGKIMDTGKGQFTDIYLEGYNKAVPFYKNMGFNTLDTTKPDVKAVSDKICTVRTDVPEHTTLMSKIMDKSSSRWWQRVFQRL